MRALSDTARAFVQCASAKYCKKNPNLPWIKNIILPPEAKENIFKLLGNDALNLEQKTWFIASEDLKVAQ